RRQPVGRLRQLGRRQGRHERPDRVGDDADRELRHGEPVLRLPDGDALLPAGRHRLVHAQRDGDRRAVGRHAGRVPVARGLYRLQRRGLERHDEPVRLRHLQLERRRDGESGRADADGDERRRDDGDGDGHDHARLDGAGRPVGRPRRRHLLLDAVRSAHARERHRRRLRHRFDERRGRARLGRALGRDLRHVLRLVGDRHALGRRRHDRRLRQLLPLPVQDLGQRRQPVGSLGGERRREGHDADPDGRGRGAHRGDGRRRPVLRRPVEDAVVPAGRKWVVHAERAGVAQVAFPDVSATSGWTGSTGGTDTTSPYASPTNYAWSSSAAAPGTKTIVATNGAGATNSDTIAISADSTAPSGQTAALSGGPYYTTLSVPLTLANGTDAQSGIDSTSGIVERDSVALSNGTCGTFPGSWTTVTLSGGADTT